jgi:hypothetical protein
MLQIVPSRAKRLGERRQPPPVGHLALKLLIRSNNIDRMESEDVFARDTGELGRCGASGLKDFPNFTPSPFMWEYLGKLWIFSTPTVAKAWGHLMQLGYCHILSIDHETAEISPLLRKLL